jgi:Na+/proline symporter
VLVNVFQTLLFLSFGLITFLALNHTIDFRETSQRMLNNPSLAPLLMRKSGPNGIPPGIPWMVFLSYMLIPLSSIMFPHMSIMCFTAKKVTAFKKTVVLYPISIMLIWLPCVYLGAIAAGQPRVSAAMAGGSEALKAWHEKPSPATEPPLMKDLAKFPAGAAFRDELLADKELPSPEVFSGKLVKIVGDLNGAKPTPPQKAMYASLVRDVRQLASSNSDSVLLEMLKLNVWPLLAGILAAGIISAVMGSDCHQILAMSTMFTKDIFDYYGGRKRFGEKGTVYMGRTFIIVVNGIAYIVALYRPPIFELAVQYAFSGFAALAPVMIAALFWRRSTKWGAFLASLFVASCVVAMALLEGHYRPDRVPSPLDVHISGAGNWALFLTKTGQLRVFGWMPVVPMVIGSAFFTVVGSLISRPPSRATVERYMGTGRSSAEPMAVGAA